VWFDQDGKKQDAPKVSEVKWTTRKRSAAQAPLHAVVVKCAWCACDIDLDLCPPGTQPCCSSQQCKDEAASAAERIARRQERQRVIAQVRAEFFALFSDQYSLEDHRPPVALATHGTYWQLSWLHKRCAWLIKMRNEYSRIAAMSEASVLLGNVRPKASTPKLQREYDARPLPTPQEFVAGLIEGFIEFLHEDQVPHKMPASWDEYCAHCKVRATQFETAIAENEQYAAAVGACDCLKPHVCELRGVQKGCWDYRACDHCQRGLPCS